MLLIFFHNFSCIGTTFTQKVTERETGVMTIGKICKKSRFAQKPRIYFTFYYLYIYFY